MAKKKSATAARPNPPCGDHASVRAALDEWIRRMTADETVSEKKKHVAALYAHDAAFFGTISPWLRTTTATIEDYFQHFLTGKKDVQIAVVDQPFIRVIDSGGAPCVAVSSGAYIFFFEDTTTGALRSVPARFSFCYECIKNEWLIVSHHSSAMP